MQPRYKRRTPRLGRYPVMALFVAFAIAAFLIPIACITAFLIMKSSQAAETIAGEKDRWIMVEPARQK